MPSGGNRFDLACTNVLHDKNACSGDQHRNTAEDHYIDRLAAENALIDLGYKERHHDLWDDDKKIEYAHVDAHAFGLDGSGEDDVWHCEDRCPRDAQSRHSEHQEKSVRRERG